MDAKAKEILEVLRAHGTLSKDEIVTTWSLREPEYIALRHALASAQDVESGPRKVGGFRIKARRSPLPTETPEGSTPIPGASWEAMAVNRLSELLQHRELEDLLGNLVYTVRLARKTATGEVRAIVARKCGLREPSRWHPGKTAALEFVRQAGFPSDLAGIPSDDPPEDFEYLEGRLALKPLQDFQEDVKRQLVTTLNLPNGRAIVTLPTGAGKTRVAVESIRDWLTTRYASQTAKASAVLWLAHSGELCEQAYTEFRQVWQASASLCPLLLFRFWGNFTQDLAAHREALADILFRPSVLVSTPQRVVNLLADPGPAEKALLNNLLTATCLVIVDEAHRAAAPSYTRILNFFAASPSPLPIVGLTATPFRTEYLSDGEAGTRELASLFGTLIESRSVLGENPRETLQTRGVLARPVVETILTSTVLEAPPVPDQNAITETDIETIDRALNLRADNPQRRLVVFRHILPICRDPENSILYFGPSILDAECMAFLLRQEGISAAVLSGGTREVTRRKAVMDFRAGRLRVLCNCEVLTTGFDAPRVTHVVVARPTVSRVLYEQIVGRGLRGKLFGGTDECVIIDCEDNYKSERPTLGYQSFRHIWSPVERHRQ